MGRPSFKIDAREIEKMSSLIEKHHGNISAMAEHLGNVDRQTLSRRLAAMNLLEATDQARALAGIKGPRIRLQGGSVDPEGERLITLDALAKASGYRAAAASLAISPRTMIRRMRRLGLSVDCVAEARSKIAAQ